MPDGGLSMIDDNGMSIALIHRVDMRIPRNGMVDVRASDVAMKRYQP